MSSPALSPELSEKNKKYDRQLRWVKDEMSSNRKKNCFFLNFGQNVETDCGASMVKLCWKVLSSAWSMCQHLERKFWKTLCFQASADLRLLIAALLLKRTPVASEFLSLCHCVWSILFIISNWFFSFFFHPNSIGQPKAKCCMQTLQEMNPDVSSDCLDESVETILSNNPEFFNSFKVVIASSLKEKTLLTLSRMLWSQNIPFVYCRSIGFIASARLQFKEHFIIESHPDNQRSDLRLEQPFEALQKYFDVREKRIHLYLFENSLLIRKILFDLLS